jgi:hypothetical protein
MADFLNKLPIPYEPKRKNRWVLRFPTELGIQEIMVASASRPTFTQSDVEIPLFNTSTFVAGRFVWEPITVTIRDVIGPSTAQAIMEWVRLHAESVTGRQGYAVGYKKDVYLDMLDPTLQASVEKWLLQGTFITSANFGDLAMDDDGIAEITLELRFDRAILLY